MGAVDYEVCWTRGAEDVGSIAWVRDRLRALPASSDWSRADACQELITWLYGVAGRRAAALGVAWQDRTEVAQDAMPRIVRALDRSRARIAQAENPAAVLQRIVERAVAAAVYQLRMAGLGGVRPNGRHWHTTFPQMVRGQAAADLLELAHFEVEQPSREVENLAGRLAEWVKEHLGIVLTDDAVDAVAYVVDRLLAGVGRPSLVRGGYAGLATDPAMGYLGFDAVSARAFARWLLGRSDPGHEAASVLDAFLAGRVEDRKVVADWSRVAVDSGFGEEQTGASVTSLPSHSPHLSRRIA